MGFGAGRLCQVVAPVLFALARLVADALGALMLAVIVAGWLPCIGRFAKFTWRAWQINRATRVLHHVDQFAAVRSS